MEFKDKLVVTDEQIDSADLQTLLNWLPNHINNEHINIHKWKNGNGWTIECNAYAISPCEGRILSDILKRFIKECRKLVVWERLYIWPEDIGYGLLNKDLYEYWKSFKN